MQVSIYARNQLNNLTTDLSRYRHQIFVERLGWQLPNANRHYECDQYDHEETVYIVAHNESSSICGCARLLPTTSPYLLQEHFSFLLPEGVRPPVSSDIWELSRLAADSMTSDESSMWAVRPILAAVVEYAVKQGARQLIAVTYLSMERLFRRIGMHAHRAAPPQLIDERMVIACWIDLDSQTLSALGLDPMLSTF